MARTRTYKRSTRRTQRKKGQTGGYIIPVGSQSRHRSPLRSKSRTSSASRTNKHHKPS